MSDPIHKINPELSQVIREISTLHEDPKNARKHQESDLSIIASSLDKHGQQKPIIATREGKVIAGNGTLAAARDILNWTHIAAVRFDSEEEAMQAAYSIVDNRSAELSSWDFEELAGAISAIPTDLVGELGFSEKELLAIASTTEPLLDPTATDDATRHVEFDATVGGQGGTTREVGDLGDGTHKCPKCGFEFDG